MILTFCREELEQQGGSIRQHYVGSSRQGDGKHSQVEWRARREQRGVCALSGVCLACVKVFRTMYKKRWNVCMRYLSVTFSQSSRKCPPRPSSPPSLFCPAPAACQLPRLPSALDDTASYLPTLAASLSSPSRGEGKSQCNEYLNAADTSFRYEVKPLSITRCPCPRPKQIRSSVHRILYLKLHPIVTNMVHAFCPFASNLYLQAKRA